MSYIDDEIKKFNALAAKQRKNLRKLLKNSDKPIKVDHLLLTYSYAANGFLDALMQSTINRVTDYLFMLEHERYLTMHSIIIRPHTEESSATKKKKEKINKPC